jgi:hypothetical protein
LSWIVEYGMTGIVQDELQGGNVQDELHVPPTPRVLSISVTEPLPFTVSTTVGFRASSIVSATFVLMVTWHVL